MTQTYYYDTYEDDFVSSKRAEYKKKDNFKRIHTNPFYRLWSRFLYRLARIFAFFYLPLVHHVKIVNLDALRPFRDKACFIYGNHTQPLGDVFFPIPLTKHRRFYTVAGWDNLNLPVIGPLLPALGAIPIADTLKDIKPFCDAVEQRIKEKAAIIFYPEAHVWPYYTGIRPFPKTAFRFPVKLNVPSFAMTMTYQERGKGKRPAITIYVDGPFYPDDHLSEKDRQVKIHDDIRNCMEERAKNSTYEYIRYVKRVTT